PHLLTLEAITAPATTKADPQAQNPSRGGPARQAPPPESLSERTNRISSGGRHTSPPPIVRDTRRSKKRRGGGPAGPDEGPAPPAARDRDPGQTANGAPIID